MINKASTEHSKIGTFYNLFRRYIHNNLFLIIGFYGLVLILVFCLLTPWLTENQEQLFTKNLLLPPAWNEHGDLNHILGIDNEGRDIFKRLLSSFTFTLSLVLLLTFCISVIGIILSCLCVYIKPLRAVTQVILRTVSAVPTLLLAIIAALFWGNSIVNLMWVIAITALPRFIHNIYQMIIIELKKPYITAVRLDGLSTYGILTQSVFPNIRIGAISEIIALFSNCLLSLTTLTFLSFGSASGDNELGVMMKEMMTIIEVNHWAFIAPGLAIMLTIVLMNFLDFGLSLSLSRRD